VIAARALIMASNLYTVGKRNDEPEQHVVWFSHLFIVPDRSREKNIAKTESLLSG
jgi:hypothetical protein